MNGTNLLTLIVSVICGNFVFEQLFGLESAADPEENSGRILKRNIISAVCAGIAAPVSFLICGISGDFSYLNPVIFVMCLAVLETAASYLTEVIRPGSRLFGGTVHIFLNSAVIAVIMNAADCSDLHDSIQFGIVSGAGLLVASLIFWGIRGKMETSDIPDSFRGIPILVIAAGLCAIIFTGFAGLGF